MRNRHTTRVDMEAKGERMLYTSLTIVRLVPLPKTVDAGVDEAQKGKSQLAVQR